MRTWWLPVDKEGSKQNRYRPKRTETSNMLSVQQADTVFQIALFKGIPNIPHIPTGHPADSNEATMAPTLENPPCWD